MWCQCGTGVGIWLDMCSGATEWGSWVTRAHPVAQSTTWRMCMRTGGLPRAVRGCQRGATHREDVGHGIAVSRMPTGLELNPSPYALSPSTTRRVAATSESI